MKKGKKYPPEILTRQEIMALLAVLPDTWYGKRNRALIITLWRAGLRLSEALDLEVRDVNTLTGTIHVRHGKGDRARVVGIDRKASDELESWMNVRGYESGYLFCTRQGGRITSSYVRSDLLPALRKRAGIDKRVHAHGFRHTLAFELAMEGVPVEVIRKQLGHTNLGTTTRYLDHLGAKDVIDAMRARSW